MSYHKEDLLEISVVGKIRAGVGEQGRLYHVLTTPYLPTHVPGWETLNTAVHMQEYIQECLLETWDRN